MNKTIKLLGISILALLAACGSKGGDESGEQSLDPQVQSRLEELIHTLQYEQLKKRLVEWNEQDEPDLLEGMWLVATYQYPDLDLQKLRQDLEQIYYEAWLNKLLCLDC